MPRRPLRRTFGYASALTSALTSALAALLVAAPAPAEAQTARAAAAACRGDVVCLALVAKDYPDCAAFQAGVAEGWYPHWAAEQTGVCVKTERGDLLYGFTGRTDRGMFDFFALSPRGVICHGSGHRSLIAIADRTNVDGAASFACSNGQVGTAEFAASETGVSGRGRFLGGSDFELTAFDMRGFEPPLFPAPPPPEGSRSSTDGGIIEH